MNSHDTAAIAQSIRQTLKEFNCAELDYKYQSCTSETGQSDLEWTVKATETLWHSQRSQQGDLSLSSGQTDKIHRATSEVISAPFSAHDPLSEQLQEPVATVASIDPQVSRLTDSALQEELVRFYS